MPDFMRPEVEKRRRGFRARLSAPGYLDCTDWGRCFPTEAEALRDLCETHGLCVHCMEMSCEESDSTSWCYRAALDSFAWNIRNAHCEFLRGRLHSPRTSGGTCAQETARSIRKALAQLATDPEGDTDVRADIARAGRMALDEARRSILSEALALLRGFADPGADVTLHGVRFGKIDAQLVRLRFPGVC